MTEAESKKMQSLEQQVASLEAQINYLVGVLDIKAPYCDECEYRDELVEEPEEAETWCPYDDDRDGCARGWRWEARNAVEGRDG